jgi:metal-sulfur cluster biosynthetic enzyme
MKAPDIKEKDASLKKEILETLHLVIDPELQINIIDMGLVYGVDINEVDKKIEITMTLSSPNCPMGNSIVGAVENCLHRYFNKYKAEVNLVWQPAWSFEKISEEGKNLLGL